MSQQEASVADATALLKTSGQRLVTHARKLLIATLLCAVLGFVLGYAFKTEKRKAEYIIAAEEQGASGWESLLAQFGLDVGSSNPGGVFEGESLVRLFRVRSLVERALLEPLTSKDSSKRIATALFAELPESKDERFAEVRFDKEPRNKITDSALYLLFQHVDEHMLAVSRPDKKQSFITVSCAHRDPALASALSKAMIETVTDFYIETLTKKAKNNLNVLRVEADSVQKALNSNLLKTAVQSDLNINPLMQTARVGYNRSMVDLQISISLYGELVKNLKLAEIGLRKETPLIQVIEAPHYPLETIGYNQYDGLLYGAIFGFLAMWLWVWNKDKSQTSES